MYTTILYAMSDEIDRLKRDIHVEPQRPQRRRTKAVVESMAVAGTAVLRAASV